MSVPAGVRITEDTKRIGADVRLADVVTKAVWASATHRTTSRLRRTSSKNFSRTPRDFEAMTEKHPARGKRGMVITNHPLASAAGAEMLAAGGNAIDAAIAAFFTLSVVEPMMVGILGGGMAHIRLGDGRHVIIDNQSMAPLATSPTTYKPDPNAGPGTMDTIGRKNAVGPTAVASPGNLQGWCDA